MSSPLSQNITVCIEILGSLSVQVAHCSPWHFPEVSYHTIHDLFQSGLIGLFFPPKQKNSLHYIF